MNILVDADACPVIPIIEKIAKKEQIPVTLFCDTSHLLVSDYCLVQSVDKGSDAADFRLISTLKSGDIVITQDYGVAAMALGKGAYAINQNGRVFTNENIEMLLFERHIAKEIRRKSKKSHLKGPNKRKEEDNLKFEDFFSDLVSRIKNKNI